MYQKALAKWYDESRRYLAEHPEGQILPNDEIDAALATYTHHHAGAESMHDDPEDCSQHTYASIRDFAKLENPVVIVVILFSGRRRHGDIQANLEWQGAFLNFTIVCISVDNCGF